MTGSLYDRAPILFPAADRFLFIRPQLPHIANIAPHRDDDRLGFFVHFVEVIFQARDHDFQINVFEDLILHFQIFNVLYCKLNVKTLFVYTIRYKNYLGLN